MSDAPTKHHFIVHALDMTDPDAFTRRLSVREKHLANMQTLIDSGFLKVAGALMTPESITGGERKLIGSTLIVESTDIESVREIFEKDVYYTKDVWDREKLLITPILVAKI